MDIDQDLLNAGFDVISEFPNKLPASIRRAIAEKMLTKDKLGDENWCKNVTTQEERRMAKLEEKAKKSGCYPFIFVGTGAYRWICRNYGNALMILPWVKSKSIDQLLFNSCKLNDF